MSDKDEEKQVLEVLKKNGLTPRRARRLQLAFFDKPSKQTMRDLRRAMRGLPSDLSYLVPRCIALIAAEEDPNALH